AVAATATLDQSLALEKPHRQLHGRAADAEDSSEISFRWEWCGRRQHAESDLAPELLGDVLVRARLLDGLEPQFSFARRRHVFTRLRTPICRCRRRSRAASSGASFPSTAASRSRTRSSSAPRSARNRPAEVLGGGETTARRRCSVRAHRWPSRFARV